MKFPLKCLHPVSESLYLEFLSYSNPGISIYLSSVIVNPVDVCIVALRASGCTIYDVHILCYHIYASHARTIRLTADRSPVRCRFPVVLRTERIPLPNPLTTYFPFGIYPPVNSHRCLLS